MDTVEKGRGKGKKGKKKRGPFQWGTLQFCSFCATAK